MDLLLLSAFSEERRWIKNKITIHVLGLYSVFRQSIIDSFLQWQSEDFFFFASVSFRETVFIEISVKTPETIELFHTIKEIILLLKQCLFQTFQFPHRIFVTLFGNCLFFNSFFNHVDSPMNKGSL